MLGKVLGLVFAYPNIKEKAIRYLDGGHSWKVTALPCCTRLFHFSYQPAPKS